MLDKERMSDLASNVEAIYAAIEKEMLLNIAKLLRNKKSLLETDPEAWKLQQLEYLGILDKANLKIIRDSLGITSRELNNLLLMAGLEGLDDSEEALEKATKKGAHLVKPDPITESPVMLSIISSYQMQAKNTLNLTNLTLIDQSKRAYIDIINYTTAEVLTGSKTPDQALRSTISHWAEKGIPALIDSAGREWGAEGYVRTVLISTIGNTTNAMQDKRFEEWGVELVEISSHSGARPKCAKYQGKIFALGEHSKYPNLYTETSYGEPDGLFGINCGHMKYAYIEGVSTRSYHPYPAKQNAEVYKQSQKQRAIERSIRKAKSREQMLLAIGDQEGAEKAKHLVSQRQAAMREFIKQTGRTRRRDREQIVNLSNAKQYVRNNPIKLDKAQKEVDKARKEQVEF